MTQSSRPARLSSPWSVLAIVSLPVFIGALDLTIISAVLPHIIISLKLVLTEHLDQASWAVNGYLLAYAVSMTFTGRLSDLYGRRKIYIACLIIFMIGSYLVTTYDNVTINSLLRRFYRQILNQRPPKKEELYLYLVIFGRVIQAFGAGAMVPITIALVGDLFPPEHRAKPIGVIGAVDTLGWVLGHLYGGVMVRFFGEYGDEIARAVGHLGLHIAKPSWETLFILNIPISLIALIGAWWVLRDTTEQRLEKAATPDVSDNHHLNEPEVTRVRSVRVAPSQQKLVGRSATRIKNARFDLIGALLISLVLVSLNLGLGGRSVESGTNIDLSGSQHNSSVSLNVPFLVVAALAFVGFLWIEKWVNHPLIRLGMFSHRNFSAASATNLLVGFCLAIGLVSAPLLVNFRLSSTSTSNIEEAALIAGLLLSGLTVPMALAAIPGGWLAERYGYRLPTSIGLALACAGFLLTGATWAYSTSYWLMGAQMGVIGIGLGLTISPIGTAVLNDVDPDERGTASALVLILRLVGMTLAISSLTVFALNRYDTLVEQYHPSDSGDIVQSSQAASRNSAMRVIDELQFVGAGVSAAALLMSLALRGGQATLSGGKPVAQREQEPFLPSRTG